MNRFQFVADHQHAFEVKRLCQAVEVSRSSFYAWCAAAPARAERVVADAELAERIRTVQDPKTGGDPAYGAPRVTAELNDGVPAEEAMRRLLHFIGARPLVGYYLEFDVAMINRTLKRTLGLTLPQEKIEVSRLYYDHVFQQLPPHKQQENTEIDLRFATIMDALGLPTRDAHDALNDAVMAALAFVKLRALRGQAATAMLHKK